MELSIKYLVPVLAVLDNKNYFCMVDYSTSSLYFLNEPKDNEHKKFLEKEILNKIDNVAVKDFQGNVNISKSVSSIIKDIESNEFIKKYNINLDEENNQEGLNHE